MNTLKVAIVGYGNIGRYALEALKKAPDMECAGIVRRNPSDSKTPELEGIKVVGDVRELGHVDVAILSTPSRKIEETAKKYLELGINTVDSFDIHTAIFGLRSSLGEIACRHNAASIISAGWDPGSDSVVRALMTALVPEGTSYTNFGPGRSMGHTVAAKAVAGVKDAQSLTIPMGKGVHSREVSIELEEGYEFESVAAAIKADPYFSCDETSVRLVPSVADIVTAKHGVKLEREGLSGNTANQKLEFNMSINNPALTGQMLVSAARAVCRQKPGCYTMIEVPVIDYLPGNKEEIIRNLV